MLSCFLPVGLWCTSWVIVANGDPFPVNELRASLQGQKVLVLDGAINRFKSLPFYPDCILGDFDSIDDPNYWGILSTFSEIDEKSFPYIGNFGITIFPAKDQNNTDLEKGIFYCDLAGATSIFVIQATGGRMDHTLGNLSLLKKYQKPGRDLIILTEKEQIFYVSNTDLVVEGGLGEYCAIMGYPEALMTTSGLAYNGDKYLLRLGLQESICNKIVETQAFISIEGEALVILPKSSLFKLNSHKQKP